MKALQEKRISLRSLWRRSLVIFSVIALAFTFGACNQTVDPGNGNGPPEPPPLQSTPIAISIVRGPANAGGIVFEGLPVDLTGIQANVRFSDHTWRTVGADELSVYPPVYTVVNRWHNAVVPSNVPNIGCAVGVIPGAAQQAPFAAVGGAIIPTPVGSINRPAAGYTISFRSNNTIVSTVLETWGYNQAAPATVADSDTDVRTPMGIHRPLLQVHYTGSLANKDFYIDQLPSFAGIVVEGVYWSGGGARPINTVGSPPTMPAVPGGGAPGTQAIFVQRNIPISASIYPWAWILNRPGDDGQGTGDGFYVGDEAGILVRIGSYGNLHWDELVGFRIPVRNIWQVQNIEVVTPPTFPVLFHDDPRFFPNSPNATTAAFTQSEVERWQREVLADGVIRVNYTGGGISREWTMSQLFTLTPGEQALEHRGRFWSNLEFTLVDRRGNFFGPAGEGIDLMANEMTGRIVGNWTLEANPRIALRFRGVQTLLEVPIFNRMESIEVVARNGGDAAPLLDGLSTVYRRPDNAWSFMRDHVRVVATYSLGSDRSVTATRDDVWADWVANPRRIRERTVPYTIPGTTPLPTTWPLIVQNMGPVENPDADGGHSDWTPPSPGISILNRVASDDFLSRGRLQRALVQFVSESANDSATPAVGMRQRTVRFDVGVRGYQN